MHPPALPSDPGDSTAPLRRETLRVVLDMLVPPSPDARVPGAGAMADVLRHVENAVAGLPAVRHGLDMLQDQAVARYGAAFAALDHASRSKLLGELATRDPALVQRLGLETVTCYYQQDAVVERLGLEPRPPYPIGYQVPAGDLTLLSPVIARGKIYRDAS